MAWDRCLWILRLLKLEMVDRNNKIPCLRWKLGCLGFRDSWLQNNVEYAKLEIVHQMLRHRRKKAKTKLPINQTLAI